MSAPDERALLDASPGAVVAVEDDNVIAFANREAMRLLGWDGSLIGRTLTTIIPRRLQAAHLAGFDRYVRSGESRLQGSTVRVPAVRRDGVELDLDLTIRVLRRPDGSKFAIAALELAATGEAPAGLLRLETAFRSRLYQLV